MTPSAVELHAQIDPLEAAYPGIMRGAEMRYSLPAWTLAAVGSRETGCSIVYSTGTLRSLSGGWGVFQLDDGSHVIPPLFPFSLQAEMCARHLASDLAFFTANPVYGDPLTASLAAYNRGRTGAIDSYHRTGNVDTDTAGGDYGADVRLRIDLLTKEAMGSMWPGARWEPVNYVGLHPRQPRRAALLHTNGSKGTDLKNWWDRIAAGQVAGVPSHIGAQYQVLRDGTAICYVDPAYVVYHAYSASEFAFAIEHQDDGDNRTPLTAAQITTTAAILVHHDIPPVMLTSPDGGDGVGYHQQFPAWNQTGHDCMGAARVAQIPQILAAMRGTPPEVDLTPAESAQLAEVLSRVQALTGRLDRIPADVWAQRVDAPLAGVKGQPAAFVLGQSMASAISGAQSAAPLHDQAIRLQASTDAAAVAGATGVVDAKALADELLTSVAALHVAEGFTPEQLASLFQKALSDTLGSAYHVTLSPAAQ